MAGKKDQKERFWSEEERVSICAQTGAPGVSVARVARRYAMKTNLVHKWLRDSKFAPGPENIEDVVAEKACFLPVEIVDRARYKDTAPAADANCSTILPP